MATRLTKKKKEITLFFGEANELSQLLGVY